MRRARKYRKYHKPDAKYQSTVVTRFVNYLMESGKKSVAQGVIYDAFDIIKEKAKEEPLPIFERALENAAPQLEVVTTRVGGANYQVPREVRDDRRFILAARWMIEAARSVKGKPMAVKIAEEIMAAAKNEGNAVKKKINTHRMAEANRAFAHFARSSAPRH
ncbi:MAG: 30S ribosomal protein S7 [Candidatus Harrisonbacteria bacterium]|nr:30S ribosomal protein S7 [Candidatus Harrisonbacteria bacterium]